jgi:transposase
MAGLAIRADYEPAELRYRARRTNNRAQALRLVAIAAALDGASRAEAAKAGVMDRQTLRDWVVRFNKAGPDGLLDRPKGHARCRLEEGQLAVLKTWVRRGPKPERDGVSAWRIVDAVAFCE